VKGLAVLSVVCLLVFPLVAHGQGADAPERRLEVLGPEETIPLDPAFESIMKKIDSDLKHIISSPVRLTPKGTALTGLTLLTTLFLLDRDEDYLSEMAAGDDENSDRFYERMNVIGGHIPEMTAGFYLLGYFLDDAALKSRSLAGVESIAISALISAGSGYLLGHKSPEDTTSSGKFEPLSQYHSMPDMTSAMIFSVAGAFTYDQPWYQSILIYGIAAGTSLSRLYYEKAWPSDVFLGSVLGLTVGRTIASRSMGDKPASWSVLPILEYDARPAVGLKVEFRL
jgi:hypothetical protein